MGTNMHVTFLDWLASLFTQTNKKDIDAYLSESVDNHDLERRIKLLTRKGMM
jgi:Protein of unknown function (DUF3563)